MENTEFDYITKYEYDEKGRIVKEIVNGIVERITSYEEKENNKLIINEYDGDGKLESTVYNIYNENNKILESTVIYTSDNNEYKRIYEYNEDGKIKKETNYINGKEKRHFIYKYDKENNSKTIFSNYDTAVIYYKNDRVISYKLYTDTKHPYLVEINDKNYTGCTEYTYNDDGTRCSMTYKDYNGTIRRRNESEYFFSTIANKYLRTKEVEMGSFVTRTIFYKYNDKDQLIEEKEISDYSRVLEE